MAGRNSGGRKGRGGRNSSRTTTSDKSTQQETKETTMEFVPHVAGKHQTVTYDTVIEHILQEMQKDLKNGYDTVESLRTGTRKFSLPEPNRQIATARDLSETAESVKQRQDSYNFKFNMKYKEWMSKEDTFKENTYKAYSIIFGYCNKTMQNRIEEMSNFDTIRNDPWELLVTIKLRMCGQVRAKYECVQPTDTLVQFLTLKQDHGESLADFSKRFKQAQDNLRGILGNEIMHNYVQNTDKFKNESDTTIQQKMIDNSFNIWCAHVYIEELRQQQMWFVEEEPTVTVCTGSRSVPRDT